MLPPADGLYKRKGGMGGEGGGGEKLCLAGNLVGGLFDWLADISSSPPSFTLVCL